MWKSGISRGKKKIMPLDVMKMSNCNESFQSCTFTSMLILLQMGNILQTGISLQSLRSFPINHKLLILYTIIKHR